MSVRATLKALVEAGLVRSGTAALGRVALRGRSLVLAYHNVVPDDCPSAGDRSLHLSRRVFASHIDQLQGTHVIVPLAETLTPAPPGSPPRVAITFDDAYRGAVTIGVEELAKRGVPATVFVVPSLVGRGPFWWDALASERDDLDPGVRERAVHQLGGRDDAVRSWAQAQGLRAGSVPEWLLVASEDELRAATRHPGIMLASHTWSHPNLARLSPAELERELCLPLTWLRERSSRVTPWLSYPYGLANAAVEAAASAAGYVAAVTLGGRWFAPHGVRRYAVPRLNVPSRLSAHGFALRASGLHLGRA